MYGLLFDNSGMVVWIMWVIIICSLVAMTIIGERFWSLQKKYISPPNLVVQVQQWLERKELDDARINLLGQTSPLGKILAAGLTNRFHPRYIVKEAIEDTGRHVIPELERWLGGLGTIAMITPFLGLLGTVMGMIQMFYGLSDLGAADPIVVAGGISSALITTAAGITVAIPCVMAHRFFRARVDNLIIDMEQEAIKLVDMLHEKPQRSSAVNY